MEQKKSLQLQRRIGKNNDEVPKDLINLLKFVSSPLSESENVYDDEFISKLQATIQEVKRSREMHKTTKNKSIEQISEEPEEDVVEKL